MFTPANENDDELQCRFCFEPILDPKEALHCCECKGTIGSVHFSCLLASVQFSRSTKCRSCLQRYRDWRIRILGWYFVLIDVCRVLGKIAIAFSFFWASTLIAIAHDCFRLLSRKRPGIFFHLELVALQAARLLNRMYLIGILNATMGVFFEVFGIPVEEQMEIWQQALHLMHQHGIHII